MTYLAHFGNACRPWNHSAPNPNFLISIFLLRWPISITYRTYGYSQGDHD